MLTEVEISLWLHLFIFSFIIFINTLSVFRKLPWWIPQSNLTFPQETYPGKSSQIFELYPSS